MALAVADRVRETTTTTGTGTITLAGAVTGYQSFSAIGNGNTTYYTINAGSQWEVGIGTYTASGTTLSRDTVLASSNAGSLVNFSAGTKDVFATYPAGKAVYQDASGNVGIGTASPLAELHLYDAAAPEARLQIGTTTSQGAFTFYSGSTKEAAIGFTPNSANLDISSGRSAAWGGYITFTTDTSERMRINSAGNVGIGTSSPGQLLDVRGVIAAGTSGVSSYYIANYNGEILAGVDGSGYYYGVGNGATSNIPITMGDRASYIAFRTSASTAAGSERMRITNVGDVGIGTASPGAKLAVVGTTKIGEGAASNTSKLMVNTLSGTAAGIQLFQDGNESWIIQNPASTTALTFANSGTERMRIDSAGNVGIGATPSYRLHVNSGAATTVGFFQSTGTSSFIGLSNASYTTYLGSFNDGSFRIQTPGSGFSDKVTVDISGNVGIGTTSPASPLEVYNASGGWIRFGNASGTGEVFADGSATLIGSVSNHPLLFRIGSAEKMRISTAGFVGIGTNSPSSKLTVLDGDIEVNATGLGNTLLSFNGTTANLTVNSSSAPLVFGTNSTERMRITGTGNLGLGTTGPSYKLDVAGQARAYNTASTYGELQLLTQYTGTAGPLAMGQGSDSTGYVINTANAALVFGNNGTERMRIDASGNVGVGVTPSASNLPTIQSTYGIISGNSQINIAQNAYYSSGWKYTGTAAATLYFQGSGAHNWQIAASGTAGNAISFTQAMTLDASGNLGIGITNPGAKLHVAGGGNIRLTATSDGSNGVFQVYDSASSTLFQLYNDSTKANLAVVEAKPMVFYTTNTERMRIDSSGNVGIGTTAPASKLHVSGSYITAGSVSSTGGSKILAGEYSNAEHITTFGSDYSSGGPVIGYGVWPSTTTSGAFISSAAVNIQRSAYLISGQTHIWYNGAAQNIAVGSAVTVTERMRLDASGNFGVGRVSPDARLSVDSGSLDVVATFNSTGNTYIQLQRSGAGHVYLQATAGAAYLWNQQSTPFLFGTSNTERMRIDASGNVGIGTTSPSLKFVVSNGGAAGLEIDPTALASSPIIQSYNRSGAAYTQLGFNALQYVWQVSGNSKLWVDTNGSLGIGATPSAALGSGTVTFEVLSGTNGEAMFRSSGDVSAGAAMQVFIGGSNNIRSAYIGYGGINNVFDVWNSLAGALTFGTSNSERMRIASGGNVGIGTSSPNAAARLDVSSTTSGFLPPRMTTTQRDAISSPPNGLVLYNSTTDKLQVRAAGAWVDLH